MIKITLKINFIYQIKMAFKVKGLCDSFKIASDIVYSSIIGNVEKHFYN